MSKLVFNIVEIPEGESRRVLSLEPQDLDLSPHEFVQGEIELDLYRARHFIRVSYQVQADVELTCDRSLEPFVYPINTEYDVVFKTDVEEETEDEEGAVRMFDFSSNTLSIEEEVRDSVLLEVPMQKIHPKYLNDEGDYEDFETKSFGKEPEEAEEPSVDPRWEELKKLKN
ncbi:MAG: DUF177 domain-containing protein [Balneolaceae bacterium]|nr:DUF177 domain-containing protein [Balneolaceae bacterium]